MGSCDAEGLALVQQAQAASETIAQFYEQREFGKAMVAVRDIADRANHYFDAMEPWKLIKSDPEATRSALTSVLNVFRVMAVYLTPVLPDYAAKVAALFGEEIYGWDDAQVVLSDRKIGKYSYLAQRVERKAVDAIAEESRSAQAEVEAAKLDSVKDEAVTVEPIAELIDFDAFMKVDLRVAEIVTAECIEEASKLLRLTVDLGGETRQIIAGIRKAYDPKALVGRKVIVAANLKPRKMRFGVSEGMVLACGEGGDDLFVLSPDEGAKPGQRVS